MNSKPLICSNSLVTVTKSCEFKLGCVTNVLALGTFELAVIPALVGALLSIVLPSLFNKAIASATVMRLPLKKATTNASL